MKLVISTVLSVFLIAGAATAQHANIGIKGGLNAYTLKTDDNSAADAKISFHVGLLGHFHITGNFALQPEIIYSVQGASYNMSGTDVRLNLNYINVPLLFQYMFDNGFRLQAGPQLGLLASAKSQVNNNKTDVKANFETIDLGLAIGASYVNPSSNFGFDIRYNLGLSNINANSNVNSFNRGLQAGVFYLFKHKS
ncbi:MAG: porin family protein [Cyclobacteriaceae bacterium]